MSVVPITPRRPSVRAVRAVPAAFGVLVLAALAALAVWLGARLPGSGTVGNVAMLLAAALAAGAAALAARRTAGRVRRAWGLLAAGSAIWAAGQLVWMFRQGAGIAVPNDVLTAGPLILSVPVTLAGMLQLPSTAPRPLGRVLLDGFMVGAALALGTWSLLIGPVLSAPDGGRLAREYGLTYPIASVAALTVLVLVVARAGGRWLAPVLLLAAGFATHLVAGVAYVALVLRGHYASGGLLDFAWVAGFLLMAAAAVVPPAAAERRSAEPRAPRSRAVLPYLPVGVGVLAPVLAGTGSSGAGLLAGAAVVSGLLLVRQAITAVENARLDADLARLAYSDALTGLANRALFAERVSAAQHRRGGVSVLLLDLDGFKAVNDSFGHPAGDRLLVRLGEVLTAAVEPDDVVARLGGDEFAVLVAATGPGAGLRTARRVLDALSGPLPFEGRVVRVTASIGVVEQRGQSTDDLLRDADVAMYAAKSAGKACVREFEPAMRRAVLARAELEADLRHALDRGEFFLQFQPVVDLETRAVRGAEALVRWRHPRRGVLPPSAFLPLAEEIGLIAEIDSWVLEDACRAGAGWQQRRAGLTVSVNVTADRFASTDLVGAVADALVETGLPPDCLLLELTETALVADAEATISRLSALGALGVQVAIDDFGTGYSSLAYLHRLPASVLKIDKSFVDGLGVNAESTALVRVVLGLADTFGLRTVAEGVETESQRALLRALGCTRGQGYLFAPPLDLDEFEAVLSNPRGVGRARLRSASAGGVADIADLPELPAVEEPADPVEPAPRGVGRARLRPAEPEAAEAEPPEPTAAEAP
ncbi:MAG TPA: EAL domain-containing protein [Mycobacteriales bacterium]